MLVLSRKEGEQLMIGNDIVLTINRISGNRVAIGIEAPREVAIIRGELDRREVAGRHESRDSAGQPDSAVADDSIAVASKPAG